MSRAILNVTQDKTLMDEIQSKSFDYQPACEDQRAKIASEGPSLGISSFGDLFIIAGLASMVALLMHMYHFLCSHWPAFRTICSSESTFWAKLVEMAKHFDKKDLTSHQFKRRDSRVHATDIPDDEGPAAAPDANDMQNNSSRTHETVENDLDINENENLSSGICVGFGNNVPKGCIDLLLCVRRHSSLQITQFTLTIDHTLPIRKQICIPSNNHQGTDLSSTHPYSNLEHQSHHPSVNSPHSVPNHITQHKTSIFSTSNLSSTKDNLLRGAPTTKRFKSIRVKQNLKPRSEIQMKRKFLCKCARRSRTRILETGDDDDRHEKKSVLKVTKARKLEASIMRIIMAMNKKVLLIMI
ncbi:hypothetical protein ACLB2K_000575 [Fragaria x ananassa]